MVLFILFLTLGFQFKTRAQTTVEISGTIKSPQGVVPGARVDFLDEKEVFLGNCMTSTNGRFRSEAKILIGKTIKIRVIKSGFENLERDYTVDNAGDAGEFLLQPKPIAISGFVKDSMTDRPLQGVEIFYWEQSKMVQVSATSNSMGYFNLETNFYYGQIITVRVSKQGYYDKEQTLTITSEGMNLLPEFQLADLTARALRAFIRVNDKRTGKPLGGVTINYFDKKYSTYKDTSVTSIGNLELKLYQRPGTPLDFQLSKARYRSIHAERTLSEDPLKNKFEYELERDRRSPLGQALLIGSGASALFSGVMYYSSEKKYQDYKKYKNSDPENDLKTAETLRTISAVAASFAAGALISYIIYKVHEKNVDKALERKKIKVGFIQPQTLNRSYAANNIPFIGINYHF
jgi:hypothetical protein